MLKHTEEEEEEEYVDDVDVGVEEPLVSNSPVYAVSDRILVAFPFRRVEPKVWPFK